MRFLGRFVVNKGVAGIFTLAGAVHVEIRRLYVTVIMFVISKCFVESKKAKS